ncbi:hypothetical protein [Cohnella panacarvi]|uniref:hypothetical protein n=1 Tax=Cohnella panacarvi TaxID=400776 RepID=UPI00047DEF24|nr:hypothetical protein [Cohnella panacarvi]
MKRKVFMVTVMSIVIALGMFGQAVAAEGTRTAQTSSGFIGTTFEEIKGGQPYLCTYSSSNLRTKYTFTCAQGIKYSPTMGFIPQNSRTLELNIFEDKANKTHINVLRSDIHYVDLSYGWYLEALVDLLEHVNKPTLTWAEIQNYSNGIDATSAEKAKKVIGEWGFLQIQLQVVNEYINDHIMN